jgi:hypothetical protein
MLEGHAPHPSTPTDRHVDRPAAPPTNNGQKRSPRLAVGHWLTITAAVSLAVGGYVHFCLYRHGYRSIPVIGTGFLIQVISSALLAVALILPWRPLRVGRWVIHPAIEVRLGALALSIGTLIAFWLSRQPGGLFNFQERGLQPAPQALIALVSEVSALLLLSGALLLDWLGPRLDAHRPTVPGRPVPILVRARHR